MSSINRRKAIQFGIAAGVGTGMWTSASAQSLPPTARVIVGVPAGAPADVIARRLAEQLVGTLARAVVVDNRPGASGRIAAEAARLQPADGLTLLLNPSGMMTVNPHIHKKLNYDPFADFAPISLAAMMDFGFGIGAAVPPEVKTLADFGTWVKANPSRASYGTPAAGAPPHFVGDAFNRAMGLGMTHIAYRGGAAAVNDVMGGQLTSLVLTVGDLVQHARAGKLRLLASSGPARSRFSPEVPTFAELKVPNLEHRDWLGVYIVGKPTAGVLAKVRPVIQAALSSKEYVKTLNTAGIEAASSSAADLDRLARADLLRWGPIIKASGFQADS